MARKRRNARKHRKRALRRGGTQAEAHRTRAEAQETRVGPGGTPGGTSEIDVQGKKQPPAGNTKPNSKQRAIELASTHRFSRYESDFEELSTLGQGAFGQVVKAKNKYDGIPYAVKKILLAANEPAEYKKKVSREVFAIARLQHQHIVRYYQAWVETALHSRPPKEDDDEDDDDLCLPSQTVSLDEDNPFAWSNGHSLNPKRSKKISSGKDQVLYIQMEFCSSTTLKDVIDKGDRMDPLQQTYLWCLFRQLLEALAFVHGPPNHILHRDIKPANIFIDQDRNVKLGDFGLAVRKTRGGENTPLKQRTKPTESMPTLNSGGQTTMVGTPFYTSPEILGGQSYDFKADMYSLGIVLFEMWSSFGSLMERSVTLMKLREQGRVPPGWFDELSCGPLVHSLVERLLSHDPRKRPSAQTLLQSGELPVRLEDACITAALSAVAQPSFARRLVKKLFSAQAAEHLDYTYDSHRFSRPPLHPARGLTTSEQASLSAEQEAGVLMTITDHVRAVFRNHGAVHHPSSHLIPYTAKLQGAGRMDAGTHPAEVVMDASGLLLQLPLSHTVPFARFAARRQCCHMRRYAIGSVFQRTATDSRVQEPQLPPGGAPLESLQCSFDVVWTPAAPESSNRGERERGGLFRAETILVVDEIVSAMRDPIGRCVIRLNHTQLIESIVRLFQTSAGSQRALRANFPVEKIVRILRRCPHGCSFTKVTERLTKGLLPKRKLARKPSTGSAEPEKRMSSDDDSFTPRQHQQFDLDFIISSLKPFLQRGSLAETLPRIRRSIENHQQVNSIPSDHPLMVVISHALKELSAIAKGLSALGFLNGTSDEKSCCQVELDLAFCPGTPTYSGFVFEALCWPTQGEAHVLACGGDFSHLLPLFRPPQLKNTPSAARACGATILATELIQAIMSAKPIQDPADSLTRLGKASTGSDPTTTMRLFSGWGRDCRVLLWAPRGRLLCERARVASMLWRGGFAVEYTYPPSLSRQQAVKYCLVRGLRVLAVFRPLLYDEGTPKIQVRKVLPGHQDTCEAFVEMTPRQLFFFTRNMGRGKLHDAGSRDVTGTEARGSVTENAATSPAHRNQSAELHVTIVGEGGGGGGGKHSKGKASRRKILQKIRKHLGPLAVGAEDRCAILAVDLSFSLIRSLTSALHSDGNGQTPSLLHKATSGAALRAVLNAMNKHQQARARELLDYMARAVTPQTAFLFIYSTVDERPELFPL